MALLLHLETSTKVCSVALSQNGKSVDSITEKTESFSHSERLNLLIESIVKKNGFTLADLSAVSVSSGPGSYTGLRIGVSTAKGLCFALNIPLIAVDALLSLAYIFKQSATEKTQKSIVVSMIDARRMEAYTSIYDLNLYPIKPISAEIFDENYLLEMLPDVKIYLVGDAQEKCKALWAHRTPFIFTDLEADALGQIEPAYNKFIRQEFENLVYFEPFYLKDFQAGVKKG